MPGLLDLTLYDRGFCLGPNSSNWLNTISIENLIEPVSTDWNRYPRS